MTAIELKQILIHRIAEINDESFLKAIKTILDSKIQLNTMKLTKAQITEINESKNQIDKGLFIEQSELDKEFNKWASLK
ncbi:MAG: hypothetical protein IPO14_10425 [Saprospiraceae bacterium]|nr:hypothetical protein [Saprospiraceae bacterium]